MPTTMSQGLIIGFGLCLIQATLLMNAWVNLVMMRKLIRIEATLRERQNVQLILSKKPVPFGPSSPSSFG